MSALADVDDDGNLDLALVSSRAVQLLFGDGRGGFNRMTSALLPRLHDATVPLNVAPLIETLNLYFQPPRTLSFGHFVSTGRTEIATGTPEGDVVVLAFAENRLREVGRLTTELVSPDVYSGAFFRPGRDDLYVTWNFGYGGNMPKPRLVASEPKASASSAVARSASRGRAARIALPFKARVAVADCAQAAADVKTLSSDGIFGGWHGEREAVETVVDDQDVMSIRLTAPWASRAVAGTLRATDRGYEGSAVAQTRCGDQNVAFVVAR
jgi:hypothetical protein